MNTNRDLGITNPDHYRANRLEVIEVIKEFNLGFCLGNVVKYVLRAGRKGVGGENDDLRKARWYLSEYLGDRVPDKNEITRFDTPVTQDYVDGYMRAFRELGLIK